MQGITHGFTLSALLAGFLLVAQGLAVSPEGKLIVTDPTGVLGGIVAIVAAISPSAAEPLKAAFKYGKKFLPQKPPEKS
jgi:hypothetical protein